MFIYPCYALVVVKPAQIIEQANLPVKGAEMDTDVHLGCC